MKLIRENKITRCTDANRKHSHTSLSLSYHHHSMRSTVLLLSSHLSCVHTCHDYNRIIERLHLEKN